MFSAEFRQEMQKEIERNLNLRNEIRHRIITADNAYTDKKKSAEGLKYLVSERESISAASLSTSTSSSTSSSILNVMKKDILNTHHEEDQQQQQQQVMPKAPVLRPASFLTGFSGFGSEGLGMGGNFITRGMPPRTFTSSGSRNNEPSISTRFFQRLTSRLEDYEKKTNNNH